MKQNLPYLKHILDEINFLIKETEGLEYSEFLGNELLTRASARSIEIIGEAVKNLSDDLKKRYKEIEWKKIGGMRDKIIHFYFGVNWNIVWHTIKNKLPELKERIKNIVIEIEDNET